MVLHSALTGGDLHEPKGIASATSGQEYIADGAASGAWTTVFNRNKGTFTDHYTDISTAQNLYFVSPFACTITKITTVLSGAITAADSIITITKTGGGSLGTITVANSGSAEGDVDSLTPVSNNTLTANQWIKLANDGASSTAASCHVTVEYTRTS